MNGGILGVNISIRVRVKTYSKSAPYSIFKNG